MAKKATSQVELQPSNLSIQQIKAALPKLERRLKELQDFKPEDAVRDDSIAKGLRDKIDHTLVEVYGHGTLDYKRHKIHSLYAGGVISMSTWGPGPSFQELVEPYIEGKQDAVSKLTTAIALLKEKLQDFEVTPDTAPLAIDGYDLHPALQAACGDLYKNGHYAQAIESACKALNGLVQTKSGNYTQSETRLMDTVFSPNKPVLAFNDQQDESDKDEQQGMMFIYKGAFLAFRNPRAHKLVDDDPQTAFGVIRFVDFLVKMLEKSKIK